MILILEISSDDTKHSLWIIFNLDYALPAAAGSLAFISSIYVQI